MQKALKAIDTRYNGRLYRSRLEARWAVFMDALGVRFEYEPEGYEMTMDDGSIRYLPDFWLPDLECFVEIKREPSGAEDDFSASFPCAALAELSGHPVFLFQGDINFVPGDSSAADRTPEAQGFMPDGWDEPYHWCECRSCGQVGIQFNGFAGRIPCRCHKYTDRDCNDGSIRLEDAFAKAMSARFEHGARGRHGFGKQTA